MGEPNAIQYLRGVQGGRLLNERQLTAVREPVLARIRPTVVIVG
jgi:hypothetical protein